MKRGFSEDKDYKLKMDYLFLSIKDKKDDYSIPIVEVDFYTGGHWYKIKSCDAQIANVAYKEVFGDKNGGDLVIYIGFNRNGNRLDASNIATTDIELYKKSILIIESIIYELLSETVFVFGPLNVEDIRELYSIDEIMEYVKKNDEQEGV